MNFNTRNTLFILYMQKQDNDVIVDDDHTKLCMLHFKSKHILSAHQRNSYDYGLKDFERYLNYPPNSIFYTFCVDNIKYEVGFEYEGIRYKSPENNKGEPVFPTDVRHINTYLLEIYADKIHQYLTKTNMLDGKVQKTLIKTTQDIMIASLPLMVRSNHCNLNKYKEGRMKECENDHGGIFISNGTERVIIPQDKFVPNKYITIASGNSSIYMKLMSESNKPMTQIQKIQLTVKDNVIYISAPLFKNNQTTGGINVIIVFKALGGYTDRQIIDMIMLGETYDTMKSYIMSSLSNAVDKEGNRILTQDDALDYLIKNSINEKIMAKFKIDTSDSYMKYMSRFIQEQLKTSFIPHTEDSLDAKKNELARMVNKYLKTLTKMISVDNRDSYVNKRIMAVGNIFYDLMRQGYKKIMEGCGNAFGDKIDPKTSEFDDIKNIPVVFHTIEASQIEKKLRHSCQVDLI